MPRLHARHHAKAGESVDVRCAEALHVHDLMPGVADSMSRASGSEPIQRCADTAVTRAVHERLQVKLLQPNDQVGEVRRRPEGLARRHEVGWHTEPASRLCTAR